MIKFRWVLPTLVTTFGLGSKAANASTATTEPIFIVAIICFFVAAFMCIIDDSIVKTPSLGGGYKSD